MGSYLLVLNDTEDVWLVKIGSDEAAMHLALQIAKLLGGLAIALVFLGMVGGAAGTTGGNLADVVKYANVGGLGLKVSDAVIVATVVAIERHLTIEKAMHRLVPGEKKTFGKMTLSLWQQATCICTCVNPSNPNEIIMEKLFMRPIFSGAMNDSENVYEIQRYITKKGLERGVVKTRNE